VLWSFRISHTADTVGETNTPLTVLQKFQVWLSESSTVLQKFQVRLSESGGRGPQTQGQTGTQPSISNPTPPSTRPP
jgi:hypothetical protein